MEVYIELTRDGRDVASHGFTAASRMYRGPSYANIPSHAFDAKRETFPAADSVRFEQIVGARTVSPEVIGTGAGGLVGGALGGLLIGGPIGLIGGLVVGAIAGDALAHQVTGFPPIWSRLSITIGRDGKAVAELLEHSIFPSLTIYVQREPCGETPGVNYDRVRHPNRQFYYDATKDVELPDWKAHGWGQRENSHLRGPTRGNPWGTTKGVTGGSDNLPG